MAKLATSRFMGYSPVMSLFLRQIVRFAARKIAANPQARETAAKAARTVAEEARKIAREDDKARAAGRAVRRVLDRIQGNR